MVGPVRFDGLASGIDYTSIIEKLLAVQKRPITDLQQRALQANQKKTSLLQVNANLLNLKGIIENLGKPSFFARTKPTSSNESVLKASGEQIGALGAFSFTVKRLSQSHQLISNGFADSTTTALTAVDTTLRAELGGGFLDRRTPVSFLNGQTGIDRGKIKVTDSSGSIAVINLEHVVNVQDVLDSINNNTQVNVTASVAGDRITVKDDAGGAGAFKIENYGSDTTATSLGLDVAAQTVGGSKFVFGKDINYATGSTKLDLLNDSLGVRSVSGDDLRFALRNGAGVFDVDINSSMTLADVVNAINTDAGNPGTLAASISTDGTRIVLEDTTAFAFRDVDASTATTITDAALIGFPAGSLVGAKMKVLTTGDVRTITDYDSATGTITVDSAFSSAPGAGDEYRIATSVGSANGSFAAADLGLATVSPTLGVYTTNNAEAPTAGVSDPFFETELGGSRVVGGRFIGALDSTLRSLLNGGQTNTVAGELKGIGDGTVTFMDRSGASTTLNLSSRVGATVTGVGPGNALTLSSVDGFAVGNKFRVRTSTGVEERTVTSVSGLNVTFDTAFNGVVAAGNGAFAQNDSLEDMTRLINDRLAAAGVDIKASIDPESNGLLLTDFSGGAGLLTVTDATGTAASDLGIAGAVSANTLNGTDLDVQWLSERTTLASLNGGAGVLAGKFRVVDTNGTSFDVDLTQPDDTILGEVIRDANGAASAAGSGVRFRMNDTGDGLLIEDTTPGVATLRVEELGGGRVARDLNILGSAPAADPDTIDGSFEFSITIKAGSKLQDVAAAINAKGLPLQANVINDGSPINPFKMTLLSKRSGEAGRLVIDSDLAGLSFSTTGSAQNSLLLYGSNGGATDPVVISSSGNTVTNIVPGLTLQLGSTSDTPVTVTVNKDLENLVKQAQKFVETYNSTLLKMNELSFFDPKSLQKGPLFADSTIRKVRRELADLVTQPVLEIPSGNLNTMQAVGFKVSKDGALILDTAKFQAALENNFEEVESLFTLQRKIKIDTPLADFNKGLGVKDVAGNDFEIFTRDATKKFAIDLSGTETVSNLLSKINNAPGNSGFIIASISADGFSIQLDDTTTIPTRTLEGPTTVTTFVETDADIDGLADDFINGATVTFLTGANAGEVRKVLDFDTATNTVTLDSALPFAPVAGVDTYKIERELEVKRVGDATAASQLKIETKASLGQNLLKGGLINLDRDPGVAVRASERLDFFTRGDGVISTRTDSLDDTIEGFNQSIERIENRVSKMEERLIREFARLEIILAQTQSTISRLQGSLTAFVGMMQAGSRK